MVKKKTWQEFRKTGLLWFMNTILHAFGWAIVVEVERGEITGAYPARVRFRGFDEVSNTTGYQNVARYMKEEADQLIEEAADSELAKYDEDQDEQIIGSLTAAVAMEYIKGERE